MLVVSLAGLCVILAGLLIRERYLAGVSGRPSSRTLPQSMDWFWHPFLSSPEPPLIVLPNHPFLRLAHDGDSSATVSQGVLLQKESLPAFRETIQFRELSRFCFVPSLTDYTAVGESLGLLTFYELFDRAGIRRGRASPGWWTTRW